MLGSNRALAFEVDWARILAADTLISRPPALLGEGLALLGWLDARLDWIRRLFD
jgi:hypothetical protein